MGSPELPRTLFDRADETADADFYTAPRLVTHIDDATIAALTAFYRACLTDGADVLDLMSSWVSHLPAELPLGRVAGLGMNREELAANPRLTEYAVHDLNAEPALPYDAASFDAVVNAVSIQYLVQPVRVFREIARVLRPGGISVVAMSHRCFPSKAIRAFHTLPAQGRMELVGHYHRLAGGFEAAERHDQSPQTPVGADPLWVVTARRASPEG